MSKAEVTFSLDVAKLRADEQRLEAEIKERQTNLAFIRRKLEAVEVLAPHAVGNGVDASTDEGEDDRSPTTLLYNDMLKSGDALKPPEIRLRLQALGLGDKLKESPNFVYSVIWRLSKRGKIVKKGKKYRAVAQESPEQGGTGVLGTPVKH